MSLELEALRERHREQKDQGLNLNLQRGQPSDEDFDLSGPLLSCVGPDNLTSADGLDVRNYPGGVLGLAEARELFGAALGASAQETIVGNNSSLAILSNTLKWTLLRGRGEGSAPWGLAPGKMIVTTPGYDRHFTLLDALGFEMVPVPMTSDGPDQDAIERIASADPEVRGLIFVPTYSNPTGDTISEANVQRLARMETAAPDFTIFADDAYRVHHLVSDPEQGHSLLATCQEGPFPDRVFLYGSTSKVTFSGAGIGFMATSPANVAWMKKWLSSEFIGPNKIEQLRHVKFIRSYPGGLKGLMEAHARILKPKFDAVQQVLERELGGTGLATWSNPAGGYFVSLDTTDPIADRVVELAGEAGVSLTPAGATWPHGRDPHNANLRISPSRPPLAEVESAMEVVALAVKLASAEHRAGAAAAAG